MRTIGLRVTPKIIYFCVAEREEDNVTILVVDKIVVPIALNIPDRLSFLRILIYTTQTSHLNKRRCTLKIQ